MYRLHRLQETEAMEIMGLSSNQCIPSTSTESAAAATTWKIAWLLKITRFQRKKIIFQIFMVMFHLVSQGCTAFWDSTGVNKN